MTYIGRLTDKIIIQSDLVSNGARQDWPWQVQVVSNRYRLPRRRAALIAELSGMFTGSER